MKLTDLKSICAVQTTEELFGIISQESIQCPIIDQAIRKAKECESYANYGQRTNNIDEAISSLNDVEWNISDLSNQLEDIRKNIENLRSWGESWKKHAKRLFELNPEYIIDSLEYPSCVNYNNYLKNK